MVGTTPIACSPVFLNYSCDNYIIIIIITVVVVSVAYCIRLESTYNIIYYTIIKYIVAGVGS